MALYSGHLQWNEKLPYLPVLGGSVVCPHEDGRTETTCEVRYLLAWRGISYRQDGQPAGEVFTIGCGVIVELARVDGRRGMPPTALVRSREKSLSPIGIEA